MNKKDKLEILFPNGREDVFKMFHINFNTGEIYVRKYYDQGILKKIGRPTTGDLYTRVSINCPQHKDKWRTGTTDVLAHRLIFYAFYNFIPEKVDHDNKFDPYPDRIQNLKVSDSFHNRLNTPKAEVDLDSITDPIEREIRKYRAIAYAHNYYWAKYKGKFLNENGFISAILASNYRNEYIKQEFIKRYGNLDNLPTNALDKIDEDELFFDQMLQEAKEMTEEYWSNQRQIALKRKDSEGEQLELFQDYFSEFV